MTLRLPTPGRSDGGGGTAVLPDAEEAGTREVRGVGVRDGLPPGVLRSCLSRSHRRRGDRRQYDHGGDGVAGVWWRLSRAGPFKLLRSHLR